MRSGRSRAVAVAIVLLFALLRWLAREADGASSSTAPSTSVAAVDSMPTSVPRNSSTTSTTSTSSTTSTTSSTTTTLLDPALLPGHHVGGIPDSETVLCPRAADVPIVGDPVEVPGYTDRPTVLQRARVAASPLVIVLHGQNGCIQNVQSRSDLDAIGAAAGVHIAWMSGEPLPSRSWNTNGRCCEPASGRNVDDLAYIEAALAAVNRTGIAPTQVIVAGVSNGGGMAVTAACRRPDLFDAVVSVAGWAPVSCRTAELSLLVFGGTEDEKLGARTAGQMAAMWRSDVTTCPAEPAVELVDAATITTWRNCSGGHLVRLVQLQGVPHVWPKFTYYDMDDDIIRLALGHLH